MSLRRVQARRALSCRLSSCVPFLRAQVQDGTARDWVARAVELLQRTIPANTNVSVGTTPI